MGSILKRLLGKNHADRVPVVQVKSVPIAVFRRADYVIPSSEGSMAGEFKGTKDDADRSVTRLTSLSSSR